MVKIIIFYPFINRFTRIRVHKLHIFRKNFRSFRTDTRTYKDGGQNRLGIIYIAHPQGK